MFKKVLTELNRGAEKNVELWGDELSRGAFSEVLKCRQTPNRYKMCFVVLTTVGLEKHKKHLQTFVCYSIM